MIRRKFFQRLLAGIASVAFVPATLRSETSASKRKRRDNATPTPSPDVSATPSPAPAETPGEKADTARLRLWRASDTPDQPIQFKLLPQGKPNGKALTPIEVQPGNYQFSNYTEVPAGSMVAEISAPDRKTVLLPLALEAGGQSTLLVRLNGTALCAEWIDDTPDPTDSGCEFDVYNLLPAIGDIQVVLGTILTLHLTAVRSSARLTGIKRANYPVAVSGTDGSGKNFRWDTAADFRQFRKATLLIYTDAYGRIRPRINPV